MTKDNLKITMSFPSLGKKIETDADTMNKVAKMLKKRRKCPESNTVDKEIRMENTKDLNNLFIKSGSSDYPKEWRSKCCGAKIQFGRPNGEKWECSKCEQLCEYEYVEVSENRSKPKEVTEEWMGKWVVLLFEHHTGKQLKKKLTKMLTEIGVKVKNNV